MQSTNKLKGEAMKAHRTFRFHHGPTELKGETLRRVGADSLNHNRDVPPIRGRQADI